MTVRELIEKNICTVVHEADDADRKIEGIYCCDLLSIAMSKAPADSAWITVMANVNTLAVASLADVAVVILAEGCMMDEACIEKAKEQNISVLATELPIYDMAIKLKEELNG